MRCLNGGWSYSWQGHLTDRFADKYNTIYEAICNKFGADHVRLEQGVTYKPEGAYMEENEPEIEKVRPPPATWILLSPASVRIHIAKHLVIFPNLPSLPTKANW